jgi:D-serine deaminase-like pyridoxal phosphate-dependent protein
LPALSPSAAELLLGSVTASTALPTHKASRTIDWARLLAWIDGHLAEIIDVPALAGQVHLSPTQFAVRCNAEYGISPMALVRRQRLAAAQRLRAAGLPCSGVSVGSTPTALSARQLEGVTEVRAGVYVFFDLVMANVGVCTTDEIALSVLTTVIGHQADKGWAIVDAGWMAMSRDRGTAKQARDYGYGQVCSAAGEPIDGYLLSAANQEHGILSRSAKPDQPDLQIATRFPLGTQLRILPNHACATGAQYPQYHALDESGNVHEWERFYGW